MLFSFVAATLAYQLSAPALAPVATVRRARDTQLVAGLKVEGDTPKTIGEAKDRFFDMYKRPVNSMQQQFVNELLTAGTLAYVKKGYQPSRVFYLGFVSLTDIFLAGVQADEEREKLFNSLCAGLALDPKKLREEAETLKSFAEGKTEEELLASPDMTWITESGQTYSYPLGAGLLALMPMVGTEVSNEAIERWCTTLFASSTTPPANTLQKDWAFFKDAQEKLAQMQQMFMEMAAAAKRKEAKALKEQAEKAAKEAAAAEAESATA